MYLNAFIGDKSVGVRLSRDLKPAELCTDSHNPELVAVGYCVGIGLITLSYQQFWPVINLTYFGLKM